MNVIISQALATGLPVITTKHSGLPEQVLDGKNGFLIAEGDYKTLAEKILYYLGHPEIWPEFSRYGRKLVEEKFNNKILISKQIEIYQNLIGQNP
jgi:colanic acid/amylovoran biosynthesis glycosyltransferase